MQQFKLQITTEKQTFVEDIIGTLLFPIHFGTNMITDIDDWMLFPENHVFPRLFFSVRLYFLYAPCMWVIFPNTSINYQFLFDKHTSINYHRQYFQYRE